MIGGDFQTETLVSRQQVPAMVQRLTGNAKRPHVRTVDRWIKRGTAGVRLEVQQIGGNVFTSEERLRSFFERVTRVRQGSDNRQPVTVSDSMAMRDKQISDELDALGI